MSNLDIVMIDDAAATTKKDGKGLILTDTPRIFTFKAHSDEFVKRNDKDKTRESFLSVWEDLKSTGFVKTELEYEFPRIVFYCPYSEGVIGMVTVPRHQENPPYYCTVEIGPCSRVSPPVSFSLFWLNDFDFYMDNNSGSFPSARFATRERFLDFLKSYPKYLKMVKSRDCPEHERGGVYSDCLHPYVGFAKISLDECDTVTPHTDFATSPIDFGNVKVERSADKKLTLTLNSTFIDTIKNYFDVEQLEFKLADKGVKKITKMVDIRSNGKEKPKLFIRSRGSP
jgi:hypothetical protein